MGLFGWAAHTHVLVWFALSKRWTPFLNIRHKSTYWQQRLSSFQVEFALNINLLFTISCVCFQSGVKRSHKQTVALQYCSVIKRKNKCNIVWIFTLSTKTFSKQFVFNWDKKNLHIYFELMPASEQNLIDPNCGCRCLYGLGKFLSWPQPHPLIHTGITNVGHSCSLFIAICIFPGPTLWFLTYRFPSFVFRPRVCVFVFLSF